jgi:hypothetical protein
MWVWGGRDQDKRYFERSGLSVYDPFAHAWTRQEAQEETTGSIPPTSEGSRCTVLGATVYSYGGFNREIGYLDTLYALETNSVTWRIVNVRGKKPAPRTKCGLCSSEDKLYMFGGYGDAIAKEQLQERSQWIQFKGLRGGVNNEFYEMDVATGKVVLYMYKQYT